MTPICDWLDVTYSPADAPEPDVLDVLQAAGAVCADSSPVADLWRVGLGSFKLQRRSGFHRYSASGSVLGHLRDCGRYMDYLAALSLSPHSVTRLDAALDVPVDAPGIISALRARYPMECSLTRKAQPTKSILSMRPDGLETGTWYVGHRSRSRVTARVYDKQAQAWEVHRALLPPTTRYEITCRQDVGATLRDAAEPARLFWAYASPTLLDAPEGVEAWSAGWGEGWSYTRPEILPAALLRRRIGDSPELIALARLAVRTGSPDWAARLLDRRFRALIAELQADASVDSPPAAVARPQ